MTIQLNRTKAEQALLQSFEAAAPTLPGKDWVERLRREAIGIFATHGFPHRRIEAWKYTDLRERVKDAAPVAQAPTRTISKADVDAALGPLAAVDALRLVLIDGRYAEALSGRPGEADGIEPFPLGAMLAKSPSWLEAKFAAERIARDDPVAALNLAFMTDGLMVKARAGARVARPIMIVSIAASPTPATVTERHIVSVEAGASLTLIEARVTLAGASAAIHRNAAADVDIADGGTLHHLSADTAGSTSTHLAQWRVRLGEGAIYRGFQLTAGTATARNEIHVGFTGPDAKLDLSGAFLGRGSDHIDTTLVVEHSTTGCESRELFKGVLDGRARGIFQGKVIVQPQAQKTDGKQMAQALMLSEDAEFDSKPELEIYADDVACGHGSTVAEIDPAMLFYLRSRGIPRPQARDMLIESFVAEAIDKVEHEAVREALMATARRWLAGA